MPSATIDLANVHDRRRLIAQLCKTEVVTTIDGLARLVTERTGQEAPSKRTLQRDAEALGLIRVPLGNNVWRYRTADLITVDDVRLTLQDRLAADGLGCELIADGVVIRTTKGTAAAAAGLLKMLMDHHLDDSFQYVMHDHDDTILVGIQPPTAREQYRRTFVRWMGSEL